jgi:predicted metal-dependent phosphoesterase TrpH
LLDPQQIVALAWERRLKAISITDHDIEAACVSARCAAEDLDLEIVPGIEFSSDFRDEDVHILGYFIEEGHPSIQRYMETYREKRRQRAEAIVDRLNRMGVRVDFDLVQMKADGAVICRPHVADVLVEEGFVFSFYEAFNKYLGNGKPAFVPKSKIKTEEAIKIIKIAGGLAFLAHPVLISDESVFPVLVEMGLDGIETIHSKHTENDIQHFRQFARRFDLLESGGSDCHGGRLGRTALGTLHVPFSFLLRMRERLEISSTLK